jgi:TIR domain
MQLADGESTVAKIFVSHATEDRETANQITIALAKAGLDLWLDIQDLHSGDELLNTIAGVLVEAEFFAILHSRTALTKPRVLTEMRMALTSEIEKGRPKVLALRLDDCEIPIELRPKVYLDFRGRFDAALGELADQVKGIALAVPTPKQTILAEMVDEGDAELWARLSAGGAGSEWKQSEAADAIRDLRSDELEAAVGIGSAWSGQQYKAWESDVIKIIRRATDTSDAGARRIMKRLAAEGFLDEAEDLDYSKESESAYCDGSILWVLRRAARRSGLFPALPPPLPERLSSLLAYKNPMDIVGREWHALRFAEPVLTALDGKDTAVVTVSRLADPARTWVFRSPDDRAPLKADGHFTPSGLTPTNPFATLAGEREFEMLVARFNQFERF